MFDFFQLFCCGSFVLASKYLSIMIRCPYRGNKRQRYAVYACPRQILSFSPVKKFFYPFCLDKFIFSYTFVSTIYNPI